MLLNGNHPSYIIPTAPPSDPELQPNNGYAGPESSYAVQTAQPVPMFTYAQAARNSNRNYKRKQSKGLGIMQIIVGVLCIVFNAVGNYYGSYASVASIGIWGGIMFIITGSFGISAAKVCTKCKITTFMVLSIISAVITIPLFICSVIGAILNNVYHACNNPHSFSYSTYGFFSCQERIKVSIAMTSLLACLAVIEAYAAIWGSVICSKAGYCCCNNTGNQQMIPIQHETIQQCQPVIFIPQPQINFEDQMDPCTPPPDYYSCLQTATAPPPPYLVLTAYRQDR